MIRNTGGAWASCGMPRPLLSSPLWLSRGGLSSAPALASGLPSAVLLTSVGDPLAVAVGFEPTEACTSHAFEACSFGRSDTPPPERLQAPLTAEERA